MRSLIYNLLYPLSKPFLEYYPEQLRVLAYHGVEDTDRFEAQLKYIKKNFSIINVNQLEQHLFKGKGLPKKAILLTFDDGELSLLEKGLPLLEKYSIPSVCFVVTSLIGTQQPFWWNEIRYYLGEEKGSEKAWELKTWKNEDRENYLNKLREESEKPLLKQEQLSEIQLKKMDNSGMLIANHSHTHPMLNMCTESKIVEEIKASSSILKSMKFLDYVFAYPNGNFDQKVENILKEYGVRIAFLFDHKLNPEKINPLRISRIRVDAHTELREFKVKISGLHSLIYGKVNNR